MSNVRGIISASISFSAHASGVRGVALDAYNQFLVTAGADCDIKFWRFGSRDKARTLLKELKTPTGIARILLHRDR